MILRRDSARAIAGGALLLLGCSYEHEVEETATRLVLLGTDCPAPNVVAAEERADSGRLTRATRVDRNPLCWYRLEGPVPSMLCNGPVKSDAPLSGIREIRRSQVPRADEPDMTRGGLECTTDGPVLMVAARPTCRDDLDGRPFAELERSFPNAPEIVRELVASDERPALQLCEYELVDTRTRRPFGGGSGGGALGN